MKPPDFDHSSSIKFNGIKRQVKRAGKKTADQYFSVLAGVFEQPVVNGFGFGFLFEGDEGSIHIIDLQGIEDVMAFVEDLETVFVDLVTEDLDLGEGDMDHTGYFVHDDFDIAKVDAGFDDAIIPEDIFLFSERNIDTEKLAGTGNHLDIGIIAGLRGQFADIPEAERGRPALDDGCGGNAGDHGKDDQQDKQDDRDPYDRGTKSVPFAVLLKTSARFFGRRELSDLRDLRVVDTLPVHKINPFHEVPKSTYYIMKALLRQGKGKAGERL